MESTQNEKLNHSLNKVDIPFIPTLCPKCQYFTFISLTPQNNKKVAIKCPKCLLDKKEDIDSYLNILSSYYISHNTQNVCEKHNKSFNYFCNQCSVHLCELFDKNVHLSHKKSSLSKLVSTDEISKRVEAASHHINVKSLKIKDTIKQYLLNKIQELERSYSNFKTINENLLTLMNIVIKNYQNNPYNYYIKTNFLNLLCLNIYQCNDENNPDVVIAYFNNYRLLNSSPFCYTDINQNEGGKLITISRSITQHNDAVNCLLILKDGRLASCSSDRTIKIFDITNDYHCDISIYAHNSIVSYISQLQNSKLVSCSYDSTIKIWNISKTECICEYTFQKAHNHWIYQVISLTKNRIASSSQDKTIKIWNSVPPYKIIHTLKGMGGNNKTIKQVYEKEKLLSDSIENGLVVWNLVSGTIETRIQDIYITCFEVYSNYLIKGGRCYITILEMEGYEIYRQFSGQSGSKINAIKMLDENRIIIGYLSGKFDLIDIETKTLITHNKLHDKSINCFVSINEKQFATCSNDNSIKIWDYNYNNDKDELIK